MAEQSHTPGPWIEDGVVISAGRETVCAMGEIAQYAGDRPRGYENAKANARLIAAAPTMFDFIATKAASGDPEALQIVEAVRGNA